MRGRGMLLGTLALLALTLAVFWPVRSFDFLNADDDRFIRDNPVVNRGLSLQGLTYAFTSKEEGVWHPLTWISRMVIAEFAGVRSSAYHLANLVLHGLNVLLFFWLIVWLTRAPRESFLAAALFGLHPLKSESVAWVTVFNDLLSFFWALWSIAFYAAYVRSRRLPFYFLSFLMFALALMSKPVLLMLPFLLMGLDYWPLNRFSNFRDFGKRLAEKIPFILLAILLTGWGFFVMSGSGAHMSFDAKSLGQGVLGAGVVYVKYLIKIFWPTNLTVFYPAVLSRPLWQVIGAYLLLFAVSVGVLRSRRNGPYGLVGWLWFVLLLTPAIGLVFTQTREMANRYLYFPSAGIFIWASFGLSEGLRYGRFRTPVFWAMTLSLLLACSIVTRGELRHWQDSRRLWQHAAQVTPDSPIVYFQLGHANALERDWLKAESALRSFLRLNMADEDGYILLGLVSMSLQNYDQAIESFQRALTLAPHKTNLHFHLGMAYFAKRDWPAAAASFKRAVQADPGNWNYSYFLGFSRAELCEFALAIESLNEARRLNPESVESQQLLRRIEALPGETLEEKTAACRIQLAGG